MATLKWENVDVTVEISAGACKGKTTKSIIQKSSGIIRPGQILAVIGPSGAGKTTLFNVLAKRQKDYDVYGKQTLNGGPYDQTVLKSISGFVWQDALYHSHLTPREALNFAGRLKLPSSVTAEERKKRVDSLLHAFDLEKCADTFIGGDTVKGISGGEKKRLSIAVEVLSRPKILFLDEPTSGLDSSSAFRVMALLRLLADSGTTIIATLHQPRPSIARAIDRFLVLSSGYQVFFGPLPDMLGHFARLGYPCPVGENPLDYMLDLINTEHEADDSDTAKSVARLLEVESVRKNSMSLEPLPSALKHGQNRQELAAELADKFLETPEAEVFLQALPQDADDHMFVVHGNGFKSSWFARFLVVLHREILQKIRNPQVFVSEVMGAAVMGTIMGSFYYQIPLEQFSLVSNAIAFVVMFSVFFSFHLVLFFPKERHIFLRDFTQGIMGSSEYYAGLALSDIPVSVLAGLIFGTIFFWMVGLRPETFGVYIGLLILCSVTGASMLLALGTFAPDVSTANTLVSVVFLFAMFLNGYFARSPVAWVWIETINYLRFITSACMVNQWEGAVFECTTEQCFLFTNGTGTGNGTQVLEALGIPSSDQTSIGMWCLYTIIVLICFHIVGLLGVSFMYNGRIQNWLKRRKDLQQFAEGGDYSKHKDPTLIRPGLTEEAFDNQSIDL